MEVTNKSRLVFSSNREFVEGRVEKDGGIGIN